MNMGANRSEKILDGHIRIAYVHDVNDVRNYRDELNGYDLVFTKGLVGKENKEVFFIIESIKNMQNTYALRVATKTTEEFFEYYNKILNKYK